MQAIGRVLRAVGGVLGVIGVVALMLVVSSFEGCVKYKGEALGVYAVHELRGLHDSPSDTSSPSPIGKVEYRSVAGQFSFSYDASKYVLNDDQAQMLESWIGKGAEFAVALFQRDKSPDSLDCASLSIAALKWSEDSGKVTKRVRKMVCGQMAFEIDDGFDKLLSNSKPTIADGATVNGMPGFMVERRGKFTGTPGRMRSLCFASTRMLYVAIFWSPENQRGTTEADFNQMMKSFVSDAP